MNIEKDKEALIKLYCLRSQVKKTRKNISRKKITRGKKPIILNFNNLGIKQKKNKTNNGRVETEHSVRIENVDAET